MNSVSILNVVNRIVGDRALDWSNDHCIAVATNKTVVLYEMNPSDVLSKATEISLKPQILKLRELIFHDTGIGAKSQRFEKLRSVSSKTAAMPNIEMHRTRLDPSLTHLCGSEQTGNTGSRAVLFSPLSFAVGGGTALAVLTMSHRLFLYSRVSRGTSTEWTELTDVSKLLAEFLMRNENSLLCNDKANSKEVIYDSWDKQFAAYITVFSWSPSIYVTEEGSKYGYFATYTKNNHLIIWKVQLPIQSNSDICVQTYMKTDFSACKSMSWLNTKVRSGETWQIALGGSCGMIVCFEFNPETGMIFKKSDAWPSKDDISVKSIIWTKGNDDPNANSILAAAKGSIFLCMKMDHNLNKQSHAVLQGVHCGDISQICSYLENSWISCSAGGSIAIVSLEEPEQLNRTEGILNLQYKVVIDSSNLPHTISPATTYSIAVSPNQCFLATLYSKAKVTATVQIENSGYLNLQSLPLEKPLPEKLVLDQQSLAYPPLDLFESFRLMLSSKEEDVDLAEKFLSLSPDSKSEKFTDLQLRWFLLRLLSDFGNHSVGENTDYKALLLKTEQILVAKQMILTTKCWLNIPDKASTILPIRTIIEWLKKHLHILSEENVQLVEHICKTEKYLFSQFEICSISGERLSISDDARYAISEKAILRWPRCCFTFCTLQSFKARKCKICNTQAKTFGESDDIYVQKLLKHSSLFCGCQML